MSDPHQMAIVTMATVQSLGSPGPICRDDKQFYFSIFSKDERMFGNPWAELKWPVS